MQCEFKISDTVYYVGPEIESRDHPKFGAKCFVDGISSDSLTVSNPRFILEISKKYLSRTPPENKTLSIESIYNKIFTSGNAHSVLIAGKSPSKPSEDRLRDRISAAGNKLDPFQLYVENHRTEPQNPTAMLLRQIADCIESGHASIEKSDYSVSGDTHKITVAVEIVDRAGGDHE